MLAVAVALASSTHLAAGATAGAGGAQLDGLPAQDAARAEIGAAIFSAKWIAAPNVSDGADGLGPLYNADACGACHPAVGAAAVVRYSLRLAGRGPGGGDPVYGRQLQDRAVSGLMPEGRVVVTWRDEAPVVLAGGRKAVLRRPHVAVDGLAYGELAADTLLSLRRPPGVRGLGLVAALSDEQIAAGADPDDGDGDGIRGRAGRGVDPQSGAGRIARFGWKASAVSLASQTADAFVLDMGLSSPMARDAAGDCTVTQAACRAAPHGGSAAKAGFEVSVEEIGLVVAHLESLAPPSGARGRSDVVAEPRRADMGANTAADGEKLFDRLGCAECHRPAFVAPPGGVEHLAGKAVTLHSDLLLHDMGPGLADVTVSGEPGGSDEARGWRTAPLWGLGDQIAAIAAGHIDGLLHDGRARTIEEAILWHGGEAQRSRDAYVRANEDDRAALVAYLAKL